MMSNRMMQKKPIRSLTCTGRALSAKRSSGSALKICLCCVLSASPFRVRALVHAVSVLKCQWFPFCFLIIASARPGGGFLRRALEKRGIWPYGALNLQLRKNGDSFSYIRQRCNQKRPAV